MAAIGQRPLHRQPEHGKPAGLRGRPGGRDMAGCARGTAAAGAGRRSGKQPVMTGPAADEPVTAADQAMSAFGAAREAWGPEWPWWLAETEVAPEAEI